jgi:alpha-L-rhamnosidase
MKVDFAESPLSIETHHPEFSWIVPLAGRGRRQSAFQILVASAPERLEPGKADLWDSGKVQSARSTGIHYAGRALVSNRDYFWCVGIWDETGKDNGFSRPETFGTPLFKETDWTGHWIGMGTPDEPCPDPAIYQHGTVTPDVAALEPDLRAPLLRQEFTLPKAVRRARAFVCGLGLFELRLNGAKVGDDVLATPRTDFRKRVLYSTYDITSHLKAGVNAVGLMLGNGWFNGQKRYWGWQMQWYGSPRAIIQVEIEFEDGLRQQVVSDDSWQGSWSPITFNCIYDGERYDARLEQPGWDTAGFDCSSWSRVNQVAAPGGTLVPVSHETEQVVETLRPVSVKEPEPGVFVFDLGRNITGWVRLAIRGGQAGDVVKLHFGEAQHENGAINTSSNNAAHQRDEYTIKGTGEELFEPRFTFHGFQFVELRGYPGNPAQDCVTGCFVRNAVARTGSFECGNDLINKIHRCTLQSQLCNVQMGVPTDDTQRPERLGWGADAWATAHEALYNLSMSRIYRKWIGDFRDGQEECGAVGMIAPQAGSEEDLVWSAAFVMIPWWQYVHYGDQRILEENYPALQRYMDFLEKAGQKDVRTVPVAEVINKLLWRCGAGNRLPAKSDRGHIQISQWGDHLSTAEGFLTRANQPLSVATAFYYLDVSLMARIARVLGRQDDARIYEDRAARIKEAFNTRFLDPNLGYYDNGMQAAQAWPLAFGLVPEDQRQRVANYLVRSVGETQQRLTTGYVGTKFAISALSLLGRDDLVWTLATATTYPSWGYMLRHNRTTTCEQWNGERGSLNHAPLGAAIDEWFYWGLAGIRPDETQPGFETIVFSPYLPKDLPWAKASLMTPRGRIACGWRHDGMTATLDITVPANCRAEVHIQTNNPDSILESSIPAAEAESVTPVKSAEGKTILGVTSGEYRFTYPLPHN